MIKMAKSGGRKKGFFCRKIAEKLYGKHSLTEKLGVPIGTVGAEKVQGQVPDRLARVSCICYLLRGMYVQIV